MKPGWGSPPRKAKAVRWRKKSVSKGRNVSSGTFGNQKISPQKRRLGGKRKEKGKNPVGLESLQKVKERYIHGGTATAEMKLR